MLITTLSFGAFIDFVVVRSKCLPLPYVSMIEHGTTTILLDLFKRTDVPSLFTKNTFCTVCNLFLANTFLFIGWNYCNFNKVYMESWRLADIVYVMGLKFSGAVWQTNTLLPLLRLCFDALKTEWVCIEASFNKLKLGIL